MDDASRTSPEDHRAGSDAAGGGAGGSGRPATDPALNSRLAGIYLLVGLVVTPVTVFLLLTGRLQSWLGLGLGLGCLLVGAAQWSSIRGRAAD